MPRLLRAVATLFLLLLVLVLAAVAAGLSRRPAGARTGGAASAASAASIAWDGPETCYPPRLVAECLRAVGAGRTGYGPAGPGLRAELAAAAEKLSAAHGVRVTAGQLEAIRNLEVGAAAGRAAARAAALAPALAREHAAGDGVLAIAARHRLPPLAVLRQLLAAGGLSKAQARAALADPARLPPRLAAEAPAVLEADLGSRLNADRIKAESQAYEERVGAHLRRLGLRFQTEDDLRAAGSPLTPDFALEGPVTIAGQPVYWVDAKNYPAIDSPLVAASLEKQARKYTAHYGPGAFVFSGGVMCGSRAARLGALALDGSHLA